MSEWIDWPGGDKPVSKKTLVDIQLRDGTIARAKPAGAFDWQHDSSFADIVAYRICETEAEALPKNGGPAYPVHLPDRNGQWRSTATGMTLRDWFAGQALVGLLVNQSGEQYSGNVDVFMDAYEHADAMLAERAKSGEL